MPWASGAPRSRTTDRFWSHAVLISVVLSSLLLAGPDVGPGSPSLAVRTAGGWQEWWQADRAPARWLAGLPVLDRAIEWRPGQAGVPGGGAAARGAGGHW